MIIRNSFDSDLLKATEFTDPDLRMVWVSEYGYAVALNFAASLANTYTNEAIDLISAEATRRFGTNPVYTSDFEDIEGDLRRLGKLKKYDLRISQAPAAAVPTDTRTPEQIAFDAMLDEVRADVDEGGINGGLHSSLIEEKAKNNPLYRKAYTFYKQGLVAKGYGQSLEPAAAPTVDPSLKQFAHMLKSHWSEYGVSSLKPAMGIVTLRVGGKKYEYSLSDFQSLNEQAAVAGLL